MIWISRKKRGERRIPTIDTESEVIKTMRKLNEFLTNIVEKILKKSAGKTQSLTSRQSAQFWDGPLDAV